jgi:DNA-binding winged helix-turn-helix (wHTH) protein/Tfp pilus assembly protein PilF
MEALLLGPLELRRGDRLVDLGDPRQQSVLVVLLLHANRPVSTQRLVEVVWNGKIGKTNPVPHYISEIRKAFRDEDVPAEIKTEANGYRLVIDPADIDVERFSTLCATAEAAKRAGDNEGRLTALRAAVALWRGPFLDGLDIDRVGGTSVVSPEPKYLDALGDLAELELKRGEHRLVRDLLQPVGAAASVAAPLDPAVALLLGWWLSEQGRVSRSRHWYGEAAASGHSEFAPRAMVNLGMLEREQGDLAQARRWFGEAVASGHSDHAPGAMVNLGALEMELGEVAQARYWWGEAVASHHAEHAPAAMVNLGKLGMELGELERSRDWLRRAAATHSPAAEVAARELKRMNERQEQGRQDQAAVTHFAERGYLYSDPLTAPPAAPFDRGGPPDPPEQ